MPQESASGAFRKSSSPLYPDLMRFVIFVIDTTSNSGNADEMLQIDKFNDSLVKRGALIQAVGIASPDHAVMIDNRFEQTVQELTSLNSSPYYSGFWLVKAETHDDALDMANAASLACNRVVELRPLL